MLNNCSRSRNGDASSAGCTCAGSGPPRRWTSPRTRALLGHALARHEFRGRRFDIWPVLDPVDPRGQAVTVTTSGVRALLGARPIGDLVDVTVALREYAADLQREIDALVARRTAEAAGRVVEPAPMLALAGDDRSGARS